MPEQLLINRFVLANLALFKLVVVAEVGARVEQSCETVSAPSLGRTATGC